MTHRAKTFLRSLIVLLALLLGLFSCPPTAHAGQNSGPERDAWNHPEDVMNALGTHPGSAVAEVGCGRGYFVFKFAARVGREGKVYAEDLREDDLASIRSRAEREGLTQIVTIHGEDADPRLPAQSLDAVLVMNAYHEFRNHDAMLAGILRALKPGGLLALIDGAAANDHPRDYYDGQHRLPEHFERQEAEHAGFHFLRSEPGFTDPENSKEFYFLVFEKPKPPSGQ
jgi:predicted methyltransferase